MKSLSTFIITAAIAVGTVPAEAFVTGFDFNNINDAQNVGDRTANFGGTATEGNPEREYFMLYTEFSSYASDGDPYSGLVANPGSGWWQADDDLGGGFGRAADGNVHTVRGSDAGLGADPAAFTLGNVTDAGNALQFTGAVNDGWFSFGIDAGSNSLIQDLSVGFQVKALDATFAMDQNWWLIDGGNAADIADGDFSSATRSGTFDVTLDYADWVLDLGDVQSGSLLVFGIATTNEDPFVVGPASGLFYDNVTFNGAGVIPEPSTYAIIAGLLVLGFAGWCRRYAAKS